MLSLVVLQSTPFCNINCDYCYLPNRQSTRALSFETLAQTFRQVFASGLVGPQLGVVWHAGEPLVAPIRFYEAAFRTIASLNTTGSHVTHSIQTNGILITQAWCDFIRTNQVQIGVSLDGPAFIHDAHRKTRHGKGTHAKVMDGISLLQQNEIPFHVIAVVTRTSLDHPDEIFSFFLEHAVRHIGFNIEETEGVHISSSLAREHTEGRYRHFLRRIHALVRESAGAVTVREFEQARAAICGDPKRTETPISNHQVDPLGIISVDCDGNVSTFSPELLGQKSPEFGDFVFGNVWGDGVGAIQDDETFRRVVHDIAAGVDLCRQRCEYFDLCGGGAPANKYFEHGSFRSTETMFCRYSIQTPIDIVLEELEASRRTREVCP